MENGTLVVTSDRIWSPRLRKGTFALYVDGSRAGRLTPTGRLEVTCDPGTHRVELRYLGLRSDVVKVEITSGESETLIVEDLAVANDLGLVVRMLHCGRRMLRLLTPEQAEAARQYSDPDVPAVVRTLSARMEALRNRLTGAVLVVAFGAQLIFRNDRGHGNHVVLVLGALLAAAGAFRGFSLAEELWRRPFGGSVPRVLGDDVTDRVAARASGAALLCVLTVLLGITGAVTRSWVLAWFAVVLLTSCGPSFLAYQGAQRVIDRSGV